MKVKLRCWLDEHPGQGWSDALPDVVLAMNRQSHTSLGGKMPYEVFYGRKPRWEERVGMIEISKVNDVEDETLDIVDEALWKAQVTEKENAQYSDGGSNTDDDYFPNLAGVNIFDDAQVFIFNYYNLDLLTNL